MGIEAIAQQPLPSGSFFATSGGGTVCMIYMVGGSGDAAGACFGWVGGLVLTREFCPFSPVGTGLPFVWCH